MLGAVAEQLQLGLVDAGGRDRRPGDVAAGERANAALLADDGALERPLGALGAGGSGQLELEPGLVGRALLLGRQHVRQHAPRPVGYPPLVRVGTRSRPRVPNIPGHAHAAARSGNARARLVHARVGDRDRGARGAGRRAALAGRGRMLRGTLVLLRRLRCEAGLLERMTDRC